VQVSIGEKLARCRQCGSADFAEEARARRRTVVLRCTLCGRKTRRLYLALQIAEEVAREAQEGLAVGRPVHR
jgi:uncharacterized Zn finger protein